ncbi:MAG TPA: type II toxin-antitoxin system RelE/ParE family toxin [Candidatus Limnocylindria bacterium]|nr:type II toxin-antitoxin system RelE/ParE family toxin [Candidatus Limnocylindria bacterium]
MAALLARDRRDAGETSRPLAELIAERRGARPKRRTPRRAHAAYRVHVQRSAERDLELLAPALFDRIARRLVALGAVPRPSGAEKLVAIEAYRLRAGDDRVVYEVNDRTRVVIVTRIRHRREVYRRLR